MALVKNLSGLGLDAQVYHPKDSFTREWFKAKHPRCLVGSALNVEGEVSSSSVKG